MHKHTIVVLMVAVLSARGACAEVGSADGCPLPDRKGIVQLPLSSSDVADYYLPVQEKPATTPPRSACFYTTRKTGRIAATLVIKVGAKGLGSDDTVKVGDAIYSYKLDAEPKTWYLARWAKGPAMDVSFSTHWHPERVQVKDGVAELYFPLDQELNVHPGDLKASNTVSSLRRSGPLALAILAKTGGDDALLVFAPASVDASGGDEAAKIPVATSKAVRVTGVEILEANTLPIAPPGATEDRVKVQTARLTLEEAAWHRFSAFGEKLTFDAKQVLSGVSRDDGSLLRADVGVTTSRSSTHRYSVSRISLGAELLQTLTHQAAVARAALRLSLIKDDKPEAAADIEKGPMLGLGLFGRYEYRRDWRIVDPGTGDRFMWGAETTLTGVALQLPAGIRIVGAGTVWWLPDKVNRGRYVMTDHAAKASVMLELPAGTGSVVQVGLNFGNSGPEGGFAGSKPKWVVKLGPATKSRSFVDLGRDQLRPDRIP